MEVLALTVVIYILFNMAGISAPFSLRLFHVPIWTAKDDGIDNNYYVYAFAVLLVFFLIQVLQDHCASDEVAQTTKTETIAHHIKPLNHPLQSHSAHHHSHANLHGHRE